MNVVGLGKAGCAIADALGEYSEYVVYKIDNGLKGERCFSIPELDHPEKYETNPLEMEGFFREIDEEVVFILSGGSKIAGAALTILRQLRHCKITILYIKPNLDTLEDMKIKMHRVCFGALQEYARSAVFDRFIAIDNDVVETILGDVPIIGYYDKLNELIVWVFHMLNVLKNSEPVMGRSSETKETSRISTIGTVDFESGEEKMLFPLDSVREKGYFYLLRNEDLLSSGSLLRKISQQVKNLETEDARSSYTIYSSDYDQNFVFCMFHTPYVQRSI
jgi:hypothetical protein